jgi:hypothetical protein
MANFLGADGYILYYDYFEVPHYGLATSSIGRL